MTTPSENTPTDNTPKPGQPSMWDDTDVTPTAPEKGHYQGGSLYDHHGSTSNVPFFVAWAKLPYAFPVLLLLLVGFVVTGLMASHGEKEARESQAEQAKVDWSTFQALQQKQGMGRACLATPRTNVPAQYIEHCQDVVKTVQAACKQHPREGDCPEMLATLKVTQAKAAKAAKEKESTK